MRGIEQIPWVYDTINALAERTGFGAWRRWLASGASGLTLDLGTGTGRNLPLYPSEVTVIGLELDRGVLGRARSRAPHVPLVVGSAEALPFRDGAFQTVVSGLVFCSVADPLQGLREVERVLRKDGRLLMLEHVRSTNRLWGRIQDLIQPVHTWVAGGCRLNRDTEATVVAAGFTIDPVTRRANGTMRRFVAVRRDDSS